MNGYICFYNRKRIEIYAETLYEAKKKAIIEFKVKKNKEHMISIILAEKDGEEVIHTPID
jgi:hypothetical protein